MAPASMERDHRTRDYSTVTETPGTRITQEAMEMMATRYAFAGSFCKGKAVLEVACGSGQGLGFLKRSGARLVVGGDCTTHLLKAARGHYGSRISLAGLDAHSLPFKDRSFDLIILFEAIYYLALPDVFLKECRRVLGDRGVLLISSVNRDWADFNPSPFSTRYLSAEDLDRLLEKSGFKAEILAAFPSRAKGPRDRIVSLVKRAAITFHLMPGTMKAKEVLKRIFLGKLVALPPEIQIGGNGCDSPPPLPAAKSAGQFKVLYAVARI